MNEQATAIYCFLDDFLNRSQEKVEFKRKMKAIFKLKSKILYNFTNYAR